MREAAERLTFCSKPVRKNFRNEHPDDRALADGVRGDEGKDARRHDGEVFSKERPRAQSERPDVAERSDVEQRASTEAINQPQADEREDKVRHANTDGLQQRGLLAEACEFENARREVEDRVDA